MKSLKILFIPDLSILPSESVIDTLIEKTTQQHIDQLNWPSQFSFAPKTTFRIARDQANFYIYYCANDSHLKALYSEDLSKVWTDSCVEFFVQIPGDENYFNFEFNCLGTCYAAKRIDRPEFKLLTSTELSQIKRFSSIKSEAFSEKTGNFDWSLLVVIPFSLVGIDSEKLPSKIRANFYKCADDTSKPHFVSWSPILTPKPDFHRPEFFGELNF